jgi:AcrR family transcriptional regulator
MPRPTKGDERRERLLHALRELLRERALDSIGVAEIARAAGVTRSGFYFYFPTKAAAVAALLSELRDRVVAAGGAWYDGDESAPRERVRAAVEGSIRLWRGQAALMVAMLDAAGQDPEVRQAWSSWIDEFVDRIAGRIDRDRRNGMVKAETSSTALASLLMGATVHAMEREVRSVVQGGQGSDGSGEALIELWYRTLYV